VNQEETARAEERASRSNTAATIATMRAVGSNLLEICDVMANIGRRDATK